MMRLPVFVVATLLVLAGCGDGDRDEPPSASPASPSPPETSTSVEPSEEPEEPSGSDEAPDTSPEAARAAYDEAWQALVAADTGHVRGSAALSVDFSAGVDGDYEISSSSSSGALEVGGIARASEAERTTADFTWAGEAGWYRKTDDSGTYLDPCWAHVSREEPLPAGDPILAVPLGFPAAVEVLRSGEGLLRTRDDIRTQVDLFRLALVFGPAVPAALGLDHEGQGKGFINVVIKDGRIVGWGTSSGDFLRAVEEAGITLPSELDGYLSQPQMSMGATFTEPGQAVDVAPPPAGDRCTS